MALVKENLDLIIEEIKELDLDLESFKSFNDFWQEIETINHYEEYFHIEKDYWKPYFEAAFNELTNKKEG